MSSVLYPIYQSWSSQKKNPTPLVRAVMGSKTVGGRGKEDRKLRRGQSCVHLGRDRGLGPLCALLASCTLSHCALGLFGSSRGHQVPCHLWRQARQVQMDSCRGLRLLTLDDFGTPSLHLGTKVTPCSGPGGIYPAHSSDHAPS